MMTEFQLKKMALTLAVFAFCLLTFGSWLNGARIVTSFVRGVEGFCIFGLLFYVFGSLFFVKRNNLLAGKKKRKKKQKGVNLDQTA